MTIKQIFDEIGNESSTKQKEVILAKHKDNELLKRVLYLAHSPRVKYYIKQILPYMADDENPISLELGLDGLTPIISRELTGNAALTHLANLMGNLSTDDADILERIIARKTRINLGTTIINKIWKGHIEETPYMGAVSFDEKKARKIFEKGGLGFSQIKMDGRYCNVIIEDGVVTMESRQGSATVLPNARFLNELTKFGDCVLNGELTIDGVPRYESNGIISSLIDICDNMDDRTDKENAKKMEAFVKKHGDFQARLDSIRFTVWDVITLDEYIETSCKHPYHLRLIKLDGLIRDAKSTMVSLIESRVCETYGEAMSHFQEALEDGQEGTILKSSVGEWKDGKPVWQIKMKLEMDVDLRIIGFKYGGKNTKNEHVISSLIAESSDGFVVTDPSGMKESEMIYVTENQDKLLGTIVQCRCCGLSKNKAGNYALLHPSVVTFRDDKNTCDSLESIREIENMVKTLIVN